MQPYSSIPKIRVSPLTSGVKVGLVILGAEFGIMLALEGVFLPLFGGNVGSLFWKFLDPLLLTIIVAPMLYLWILRPMNEQQQILARQTDELRDGNKALRESEARNRAISQTAYDAIITSDSAGHIAGWNRGAQRIFGCTESEVMNQPVTQLIPERYRAQHLAGMDRIGSGAEAHVIGKTVELSGLHQDGSEFPLELSLAKWETTEGWFVTAIIRDITERKQMEDQIRQLAFYDPLTQLPNRRLLLDRLGQSLTESKRSGSYGALMFLDLDNFKALNDTLGHAAGDLLLQQAARRAKACVREADTVARLGGDEFVVLLGDLDTDKAESTLQAGNIAEKIRSALAEPYELTVKHEGQADAVIEHQCSASIGVVVFIDSEGSQDDFLKWADSAMYRAKDAGRNLIRLHGADPRQQPSKPA